MTNTKHRSGWDCEDCKCDTFTEYYMIQFDLWDKICPVDPNIMLCISCVETRLGRELKAADFTDCPLNQGTHWEKSPLLQKRLKAL